MDSETIKNEVREIFAAMGFAGSVEAVDLYQGATSRVSVYMRGDARALIGEHGNNLAALEHIIRRIISKKNMAHAPFVAVKIDLDLIIKEGVDHFIAVIAALAMVLNY